MIAAVCCDAAMSRLSFCSHAIAPPLFAVFALPYIQPLACLRHDCAAIRRLPLAPRRQRRYNSVMLCCRAAGVFRQVPPLFRQLFV